MEPLVHAEKIVNKPGVFGGEPGKWLSWRFDFENYLALLSANFVQEMAEAASKQEPVCDELQRDRSTLLYSVLASSIKADLKSLAIMLRGTRNGFELWRQLVQELEPSSNQRRLAMTQQIYKAPQLQNKSERQFAGALREWEASIRELEEQPTTQGGSKKFDEDMKIAILLENCPSGLRTHLSTSSGVTSYKELRDTVETYLRNRGVWNIGDAGLSSDPPPPPPVPMEIGAIGKGKGKGKGKAGGCNRCGNSMHRSGDCPHKDKQCSGCGKIGHLRRV